MRTNALAGWNAHGEGSGAARHNLVSGLWVRIRAHAGTAFDFAAVHEPDGWVYELGFAGDPSCGNHPTSGAPYVGGRPNGACKPTLMMIFEVQLARDRDKHRTWPAYQAVLRAQYRCPTMVVVLGPDRAIARWCAEPIDLDGRGASIPSCEVGNSAIGS